MGWDEGVEGVMDFPSGRRVRGRALRGVPDQEPEFGLYLLWRRPTTPWPHRWVKWPDFGLPANEANAREAMAETWARALDERVEVACGGGRGRTGTALAAFAMLDGLDRDEAIAWVRERYDPHEVETPWQRRWLSHWPTRA